ncbi:unnamed protein product (macronuclear) [Paramecium tetraurelia]|uniref:Geranylgeranyl transferase type-2 subunit alpha n=1 Tax=Paramecium tetraurelia TaxID=5888 RepID=A0BIX3_PARTE|nr:uncharacterized protein GSPATT00004863001 [Paramecium tetraurelia]CAK58490.1 unnamed protein product [Paramecium tetraurelia]|eukprot:XP_001425888.1 hypothetical protein (macronuclear) [Paramecium tetraurelia strain d4-2]
MMHGQSKSRTEILSEEEIKQRAEKGQQILDSLDYFFKVRKNQVNQPEDQLAFSELMAKLCPEIATIYNYRREVLQTKFDHLGGLLTESKSIDAYKQLVKLIQSEFMLIAILLKQHPKSYTLWTHRQWMVLRSQEIDQLISSINQDNQLKLIEAIKQEYELCSKMLDRDERNFHVWNYRNWLSSICAFGREDEFTKKKIEQNFSNFSAYHFRSKFFMKNYNQPENIIERIKSDKILEETELIQQAIYIQPKEHGVFLYHRWLVGVVQPFGVTKVEKISNNSVTLQFNRAITNVENSFELFNNENALKIINVKVEGINVIITFEEQQLNNLKIRILNQIYQNGALDTMISEDEFSKFLIPSEIDVTFDNEGFKQTNTIQQEFQGAIHEINKYLDENIDFIKQVIEEEKENRFPYIQILYLFQFKLRTQKLIDASKSSEIVKEALQHCDKLKKIQNDHQAQFLFEFWSQF